jgi:hypothetical protein
MGGGGGDRGVECGAGVADCGGVRRVEDREGE